jgi:hypothetical protein
MQQVSLLAAFAAGLCLRRFCQSPAGEKVNEYTTFE